MIRQIDRSRLRRLADEKWATRNKKEETEDRERSERVTKIVDA